MGGSALTLSLFPDTPISEDWLKEVGFKWHQLDRQPTKHWLLWLGDAVRESEGGSWCTYEDIGIELAQGLPLRGDIAPQWFCWFRSDAAGRYHRFIHVRHLSSCDEVIKLVEAITGQTWNPENHLYGSCHSPRQAERIRKDDDRLDRKLLRSAHPWAEAEKDDTRGGALPEHLDHHIKTQERR